MKTDQDWMKLALTLAEATTGQTGSNPMVGAVVINDGRLVGQGAHLRRGEAHAEVHALQMAGERARGGTIYVTLEPCNHHGQTPPCTEAILKTGIQRVVVGSTDPDSRVSGQGIARLQQAGLEVKTHVLQEECNRLNEAYFHHRLTGLPFVTLKMATTLDGKIASHTGDSRWVTNEISRERVHELRDQYQAILVGVQTVIADDPELTTRFKIGGKHPIRIIVDSQLRTPFTAKVIDVSTAPTLICTTEAAMKSEHAEQFQAKGVQLLECGAGNRVDLGLMLQQLGKQGILSLLVEGGGTINGSLLAEHRVQKVIAFIAPKILGGKRSLSAIGDPSPDRMADAIELDQISWEQYGNDLCVTGYVKPTTSDEK
ncbi:bifunctional diaminohydroxyphosphoribosylaminopyrimidine deaminase/5-amino-6-(5-phosphoribosylamino)uracil reductase RibD [Seinonella peptonophila]|nr:bifunctional diaminohydroxyphosphoribosylaminopyrimidine deaminase/5-amino-6-(5-phosphoribosylamino)uracil reductase RibD [Seinonella peptonophila]